MRFVSIHAIQSITAALFIGMLLFIELGRMLGNRRRLRYPDAYQRGAGAIEASVFGLMGLLLAFTFYAAGSRYDARRKMIVDEANAIGTAYLRLDLLPPETQPELREAFRRYLRLRLDVYHEITDFEAYRKDLAASESLQQEIWRQAVAASRQVQSAAVTTLVLQAINQMIDVTSARTITLVIHTPFGVFVMLAITVMVASLLVGYSMSRSTKREWTYIASFVLLVGIAFYVVIDFEYPRIGLIREDPADQILHYTLDKMK
jgi:multisubunit Na+/H+ antiporter MnhG subunit